MNTTSSQLPICVHCGTPRPADETLCPTCGKPWIDTSIADAATPPDSEATPVVPPVVPVAGKDATDDPSGTETDEETDTAAGTEPDIDEPPLVVPPPPLTPDDTGEFSFDEWEEPADDRRSPAFWLIPLAIIGLVIAAIVFWPFGGDTPQTSTTASSASTTVASTTSTTDATTTTLASTTTVVETFPQPGDWPAIGEPIDTPDLTLTAGGIGPIDVGMPIDDAAGALTASLGEADEAGVDGLCPPDESYWLRFGQLTAIFDGHDSTASFVSYRYDEPETPDQEIGLETLSGIAIGDTVEDLINTYTQYTISFEVIDSKDHFQLSDGGELLLWGPVSSPDPEGLVEGIYSPTACDSAQ